jgi:hypothetical protein
MQGSITRKMEKRSLQFGNTMMMWEGVDCCEHPPRWTLLYIVMSYKFHSVISICFISI